jgi:hypothetical protein
MLILIWFTLKVVLVKEIGSVGAFYDAVIAADLVNPVQDNYKGSHLTMTSEHSIYFGIIHILYVEAYFCGHANLSTTSRQIS